MSNITAWLNATVMRSTFVAPTRGLGMGDVCLHIDGYTGIFAGSTTVTPLRKRHLDAFQAPVPAHVPWSPPVP
jgi:hypothetical protein